MQISLRKANALQQAILELTRNIHLTPTVTINEFEHLETKIAEAQRTLVGSILAKERLYAAFYAIRTLVGEANAKEINALLTSAALKEKVIEMYTDITRVAPRTDMNVLAGKLDKIKAASNIEDRYSSRQVDVNTTIFTESVMKEYAAMLSFKKKEKQKIQDKILELNISTKIELPEDVVAILTDADLI